MDKSSSSGNLGSGNEPASTFLVPRSGYTDCTFHELVGDAERSRFDDVGESMGLGEPFGAAKEKH